MKNIENIYKKFVLKNLHFFHLLLKQSSKKRGYLYFVRGGLVMRKNEKKNPANYTHPVEKGCLII